MKTEDKYGTDDVKLDFTPPSFLKGYSIVSQVMQDGALVYIGYIGAYQPNSGNKRVYYANDANLNCICESGKESEIKMAFKEYARRVARQKRIEETKGIRYRKSQKNKTKSRGL